MPETRKLVKLALWLAAIFAALVVISFFVPVYGDICSKNEYTGQENCTSHHIILVALWHVFKAMNDYGIAVTAIATALLAYITLRLVWVAREQSITSRAQLRAYVMVGTADIMDIKAERIPHGKIQIKNYGQTPAYNINVGISMGFSRWPFQDVEWPTFDFTSEKRSERPIAPGDDFPLLIDLGKALSAEQVAAIYGGRWALWIAGKVIYKDAFGEPRETEFCFFTTKVVGVGILAAVDDRNRSS